MKVDRNRFLLLTTALSAASAVAVMATGCTIKNTDKGGTTTPYNEDSGGGTDGGNDAYSTDGSDGGACLDDTGAAATCAGANASCSTVCEHYLANYKKGVARSITECIIKLPTCEGADLDVASCVHIALSNACEDATASAYCTPMVESCVADAGTASALPMSGCMDVATGLNSTGRAAFTSCVTEGTPGYCKLDPSSCIDLIE